LLQRLENLEENIATLKTLKKRFSISDIKENKLDEWSLRYGIFESIQIIIDISCHISSKYNLGSAKTYVECIENLQKQNYLNKKLSKNIISAIGLRNLLIHEYVKIDIEQLYDFLNFTDDFSQFIKDIKEYI
jgi:uncharacterized protein YutE (UPF0331/DUF86 family)